MKYKNKIPVRARNCTKITIWINKTQEKNKIWLRQNNIKLEAHLSLYWSHDKEDLLLTIAYHHIVKFARTGPDLKCSETFSCTKLKRKLNVGHDEIGRLIMWCLCFYIVIIH